MGAPRPPARQASKKPAAAPLYSPGRGYKPGTAPPHAASLRRGGAPHDAGELRALLKRLANASPAPSEAAPALHAHAAKLGLGCRHRGVRDALVALYLACGRRGIARALLSAGGGPAPDVVSWTALVTGHARLGLFREAAALFLAMADDGALVIDAVAAAAAFGACAGAGDLALAREVHRRVLEAGVSLDVVACNALVNMYAKCGDAAAALRFFRAMAPAKNVVTWNTMISAHARAGELQEALELFREMLQQQGCAPSPLPDDATFVAVLGACARLGALDAGRWVHAYMGRTGRDAADGVVGNALIDMYAKCGAVEQAAEVFDAMTRRDVYTYTSMISGLAMHGRGEEALALFGDMRRAGVRPNEVTFLGVLSACCHAGNIEDGLRHFEAMAEQHGVVPGIEHYGCVVDMLGRAGRLDEAEDLVSAMPIRPDALIWGSLLAACRAHGHVDRAERVMRRMAEDEADAGDYVLMSNMYAHEGRHGKAVQVRRQMRRGKVDKVPGCSLIEIDGVVHEFQAVPANSVEISDDASDFFS
ncbi:hypothetical protein CFC21_008458 [Triticum aestivum]|uniref:Pentatricopeptide repeat-containing protein n=3 Tax=Triticum TaxID=4564 RepID=A0A9R0R4W1_TRITD|nr:hypothetical protein CFC21_008458 [Triticum aestivum]VAH22032.1 unnamed protein product [Triticum turgidum subsp. durum]